MLRAESFMGVPLHLGTMGQIVAAIEQRLDAGIFTRHAALHVAKLVQMRSDPRLREAVTGCDLITVDGAGIALGARLTGLDVPRRVTGIDLFDELLAMAARRGEPVFLLGARPEVLRSSVARLEDRHPGLQIAGSHHGYFDAGEAPVREAIGASGATMLFVGMSSPRKEQLVAEAGPELGLKYAMGVGGAFDVVAGRTRRAPRWMQRAGMEWVYRMAQEPLRLGPRYGWTNSVYGALLLREVARPRARRRPRG